MITGRGRGRIRPATCALAIVLLAAGTGITASIPAADAQTSAQTELVSLRDQTTDVAAEGGASNADVSADGTVVAFESWSGNLVAEPAGLGSVPNVYVRDRETGRTELVSITPEGGLFPGGAWDPSVSGDGRYVAFTGDTTRRFSDVDGDIDVERVVFASTEGLFLVSDGDDVEHVPGTEPGDTQPVFSPDQRRIAFVRDGDIWTIGVDGSTPQQLTSGPATDTAPSWSPDGVQIAYVRDDQQLRIHEVDTRDDRVIDLDGPFGPVETVADPAWSPNGEHIAFAAEFSDGNTLGRAIYVWSGEGEGAPILNAPTGFELGISEARPTWSPDGERIAFEVESKVSGMDAVALAVTEPFLSNGGASSDYLTVPAEGVEDRQPTWSPDGERIVFSSNRDEEGQAGGPVNLHVIPSDGEDEEGPTPFIPQPSGARTWPSFAPTELGADTPVTLTATVTEALPSLAAAEASTAALTYAPTGPVVFRSCGVGVEGAPSCEESTQVGPRVLLEPQPDHESSTATVTTSTLTPPSDIDSFGTWCWTMEYLGSEVYNPSELSGQVCHEFTKDPVTIALQVDGSSDDGALVTTLDVDVTGAFADPDGVVTVWRCDAATLTAAGCPEGGERVAGPAELIPTSTEFDSTSTLSWDLEETSLPFGRYCFRVEYSGDGFHQRRRAWDPSWCLTHLPGTDVDAEDPSTVRIVSEPGGVDFDVPVEPGFDTVTVHASQSGFDGTPVDFYLCGPDEVTRYGCEAGGDLVASAVGWNQGSGTETDRVTIDAPAAEGVYCWRIEQADWRDDLPPEPPPDPPPVIAPRGYTDTASSCFAVQADYEVEVDERIDVYRHDRVTGATTLVSEPAEGVEPFGDRVSRQPSISDDGQRVAFVSTGALAGGDSFGEHVYVRDLAAETTTWVSVTDCEGSACAFEVSRHSPAISGDGSAVAFVSSAFDLAAVLPDGTPWDGGPGTPQVFVRDLADGVTTVESVGDDGELLEVDHRSPSLSYDGQRLAFIREEFTPETEIPVEAVYWRDRTARETALVSVTVDGALPDPGTSTEDAAISGDGHTVVFSSDATDLVADDPCSAPGSECGTSVWARDVLAGATERISVRSDGSLPAEGSWSYEAAVGATGAVIAFTSTARDLVDGVELPGGEGGAFEQVYVRERPSGLVIEPDPLDFGPHNVGAAPKVASVTVRVVGGAAVTITDAVLGGAHAGDFAVAGECLGATLGSGQTCTLQVSFAPEAEGPRRATLTVRDAETGVAATIDLVGVGGAGRLEVEPGEIDFGTRPIGETSPPETVTVTNRGTGRVAIDTVVIGGADIGAFLIDEDGCSGTTLDSGGGTCTITVRHRPTASGAQAAVLLISHDADGSPSSVRLRGGVPGPGGGELTVTPSPVDFGVVTVGVPSDVRIVTVTNTGDRDVTISGFTLTGPDRTLFRPVPGDDTCSGATVEPGRGCGIAFQLEAEAAGAPRAELHIDSDAAVVTPDPVVLQGLVPLLEIDPELGPPGFVPEVTGRFFPPNTDLELRWVSGLGITRVRTDARGEFTVRKLVFRRDRIGPRFLVAEHLGDQWASTEFLVVPGQLQPGDFTTRG